ncbi:MAG: RecQ family ATP-dependent DNA helicase [Myxococcales bacterium]|jgi:ATP-dependent DNA helicase RecQ
MEENEKQGTIEPETGRGDEGQVVEPPARPERGDREQAGAPLVALEQGGQAEAATAAAQPEGSQGPAAAPAGVPDQAGEGAGRRRRSRRGGRRHRRHNEKLEQDRLLAELRRVFRIQQFRPRQREVIEAVLAGRDTLAVLPTGSGKSLTYQLASRMLPGLTVVVSPLLALMRDQYEKMIALGMEGSRLDSSLTAKQREETIKGIEEGKGKLLLITPEGATSEEFRQRIAGRQISLLVVDEAHCVSQWGHDFRPSYLAVSRVAEQLGRPTILALTATATPKVQDDIVQQLGMRDPVRISVPPYRPNLQFEVELHDSEMSKLKSLLKRVKTLPRPGIIYCATVRDTQMVWAMLRKAKVRSAVYHGKMRKSERDASFEAFMSGRKPVVMVATNAFGLGVDKPNIRYVIHYQVPGSLEAYVQEAGRAGRDGKPARCILQYLPQDLQIQEFFLEQQYPTRAQVRAVAEALQAWSESGQPVTLKDLALSSHVPQTRTAVVLRLLQDMRFASDVEAGKAVVLTSPPPIEEVQRASTIYDIQRMNDRRKLDELTAYATTDECRSRFVRRYFGEEDPPICGVCDNDRKKSAEGKEQAEIAFEAGTGRRKRRRRGGRGRRRRELAEQGAAQAAASGEGPGAAAQPQSPQPFPQPQAQQPQQQGEPGERRKKRRRRRRRRGRRPELAQGLPPQDQLPRPEQQRPEARAAQPRAEIEVEAQHHPGQRHVAAARGEAVDIELAVERRPSIAAGEGFAIEVEAERRPAREPRVEPAGMEIEAERRPSGRPWPTVERASAAEKRPAAPLESELRESAAKPDLEEPPRPKPRAERKRSSRASPESEAKPASVEAGAVEPKPTRARRRARGAESQVEEVSEAKAGADGAPEAEGKPEPKRRPRAKAEAVAKSEAEPAVDAEVEAQTSRKVKRKPKAGLAAEAEVAVDAEAEAQTSRKLKRKPKASLAAEAEPAVDAEVEAQTSRKVKRKPKAGLAAEAEVTAPQAAGPRESQRRQKEAQVGEEAKPARRVRARPASASAEEAEAAVARKPAAKRRAKPEAGKPSREAAEVAPGEARPKARRKAEAAEPKVARESKSTAAKAAKRGATAPEPKARGRSKKKTTE